MNKLTAAAFLQSRRNVALLSAGFSALISAAVTVTLAGKRFERIYKEIAEQEIEEAKAFYSKLNKTGDFSTPEGAMAALHGEESVITAPEGTDDMGVAFAALQDYAGGSVDITDPKVAAVMQQFLDMPDTEKELLKQGLQPEVVDGELVEVSKNVFTDAAIGVTDFDPDAELRDHTRPYIIRFEEFVESLTGWTQEQLTYYAGDDVLAKDDDELVDDVEGLIGNINLTKFGLGSQDANVVYIRNEKWTCDFEVTRHQGSYEQIVSGYIEHSISRKTPRFRGDDE